MKEVETSKMRPEPRKIFIVKEVSLMEIKKGERFIMYEETGEPVNEGEIFEADSAPYQREEDGVTVISTLP